MPPIVMLVAAALAFSTGGVFMKLSNGLSRPAPTASFLALFVAGAALQALGMRRDDFSVAYIFVLGLEVVVTVLLSVFYLHESLPLSRLAAVLLVVAGIVWLRAT
jgi:quaternary ammonium compound-resistance protein SugE